MRGGGRHYLDEMEAPEATAIGVILKQKIVLLYYSWKVLLFNFTCEEATNYEASIRDLLNNALCIIIFSGGVR